MAKGEDTHSDAEGIAMAGLFAQPDEESAPLVAWIHQ